MSAQKPVIANPEVKTNAETLRAQFEAIRAEALREDAPLSKGLKRAFAWHDRFNQTTRQELSRYLETIAGLAKDCDLEKELPRIRARAEKELGIFQKLSALIAAKTKADQGAPGPWTEEVSIPLSSHKMVEVMNGVIAFLKDERNFYDYLALGKIPPKYDCTDKRVTILGEDVDGMGNSRATFLKAAVIITLLHFNEKNKKQAKASVQFLDQGTWIDRSAMMHTYSLPKGRRDKIKGKMVTERDLPDLLESCFYIHDETNPETVAVVHSGYSFGGQNVNMLGDKHNPSKNLCAPLDCSAGISYADEDESTLTTLDYTYNTRLVLRGFASKDHERPGSQRTLEEIRKWEKESRERAILKQYALLTSYDKDNAKYINDPSKMKAGDRVVARNCPDKTDPDMVYDLGGGHIKFAAGAPQPDGTFPCFDWSRNMPGTEGAGGSTSNIADRKGTIWQVYRKNNPR